MNADVFNQGDWRDLAKCRSGIEWVLRDTLEARFRWLVAIYESVMANILDRGYDTIRISPLSIASSHRRLSIKFQSTRCETSDSRSKETRGDEAFWNVSRDRGSTTIDQKLISKRSSKDSTALRKKTPGTISFLLN